MENNDIYYGEVMQELQKIAEGVKAFTKAVNDKIAELLRNAYASLRKVADYLYQADYDSIDYDYAQKYFSSKNPEVFTGGCSSVRSGGFYGRNLDWLYNEDADVVVRTQNYGGRYASVGVAGGLSGLTDALADSRKYSPFWRILPFYLQDGINENGVFCNINVVPLDNDPTTVTAPTGSEQIRLCSLMVVRYVLDYFATATSAVEFLKEHAAIYMPKKLQDMGYECHWMIGDSSKTYVLEVIDNKVKYKEFDLMTNFYIDGVSFNPDSTVYTLADVADENLPSSQGVTAHGSGLERYNLIMAALNDAEEDGLDADGMRALMNSLLFSNAYDDTVDPFWYSEFVGGDIDVDTPADDEDLAARVQHFISEYATRDRSNPVTWQTTHSCVYDIANCSVKVVAQEDTAHEYEFTLIS